MVISTVALSTTSGVIVLVIHAGTRKKLSTHKNHTYRGKDLIHALLQYRHVY